MARTKPKTAQPLTTAQRLSSIVKACRDIMRKDKGLNGDLDRLPMLTWIMFLKFLDDMEQIREEEAKMSGSRFRPALEPPYRWRDWAAKPEGVTGDELISFVNNEEAVRPDGAKGPGLFAYLRSLQGANGGDRRDVIATVFKGTINRMINGYLLRDVINKVNDIHFTSSDEIHTLGHLYESMLKEMRDAAGDSGEFYTPRPVVRFMVEVINPQLGEVILDPACGTGGFLVESFKHLEKQCKTVEDRQILQTQSIFGGEAKPLPYLLAQMNLVLHGLESPKVDPLNSLRFPLREIGDRDRVDIIMTNPPFGGEEERGILSNFPEDKQTSETALLFLQLIMRKLKRPPNPGRAAVVVPNGTLSAPGVATRIRAELLQDFNLHTIIRLPHNVFAPYTDIKTNVLFFDRTGPTTTILYCEPPLPKGVSLSKTKPLQYEWLSPYIGAIIQRRKVEYCWTVNVPNLDSALNLDLKNPKLLMSVHEATDACLDTLASGYRRLSDEAQRLRQDVAAITKLLQAAPSQFLGELTDESDERIGEVYQETIRLLGVSNAQGFCDPKGPIGRHPERYKVIRKGYLAYNPMRINIGSIGVALCDEHVGITSPDYVVFKCRSGLLPEYVYHYLRSEAGHHQINQKTKGSVRFRLYYKQLAEIPIPVPENETLQQHFADLCRRIELAKGQSLDLAAQADRALDAVRREAFLYEHLDNGRD